MRGSVVKRGKSYSVVVELDRDPVTQKRRQKWHSGFRTKREAEAAMAELVGTVNRGTYVAKSKQTVAAFIVEWLAAIKPTVRPATHYSYDRDLKLHVTPYIGTMPLTAVDAGTLNGLYAHLLAEGRKDYAGGGLSPRSVKYVHTIIHRLLRDAMKWDRLARNAADAADPPRSTSSGRPRHGDLDTRTASEVPGRHQERPFVRGLCAACNDRNAARGGARAPMDQAPRSRSGQSGHPPDPDQRQARHSIQHPEDRKGTAHRRT